MPKYKVSWEPTKGIAGQSFTGTLPAWHVAKDKFTAHVYFGHDQRWVARIETIVANIRHHGTASHHRSEKLAKEAAERRLRTLADV